MQLCNCNNFTEYCKIWRVRIRPLRIRNLQLLQNFHVSMWCRNLDLSSFYLYCRSCDKGNVLNMICAALILYLLVCDLYCTVSYTGFYATFDRFAMVTSISTYIQAKCSKHGVDGRTARCLKRLIILMPFWIPKILVMRIFIT